MLLETSDEGKVCTCLGQIHSPLFPKYISPPLVESMTVEPAVCTKALGFIY